MRLWFVKDLYNYIFILHNSHIAKCVVSVGFRNRKRLSKKTTLAGCWLRPKARVVPYRQPL